MIVGNIIGWSGGNDDIFDVNSIRNRDDCLRPYRILRDICLSKDIVLHTPDVNDCLGLKADFNLYLESELKMRMGRNYLLRMETEFIVPINGDLNYLNNFDLIFTWDDLLVDGNKYIKLNYPNSKALSHNDGYSNRPIFCCMIAGNKFVMKPDKRELYSARVEAIKWFEKNHPDKFNLYGIGWDKPARKKNGFPKFKYRAEKIINLFLVENHFPHIGELLNQNEKFWKVLNFVFAMKIFKIFQDTLLKKYLIASFLVVCQFIGVMKKFLITFLKVVTSIGAHLTV